MGTQNPNSRNPKSAKPAPAKWAEFARQLRELQKEHQMAWADWNDFEIVRFLSKTCSEEEAQKILAMVESHPVMQQALEQIQQVMDTVEIDETGQLRSKGYLEDEELREEFAEMLEIYWGLDAETICQNIEEFQEKSDPVSVLEIEAYEQLYREFPDLLHEVRCLASFSSWLEQPGRQFLYDTICQSAYFEWEQYLEKHIVPTPFQSEPDGIEKHLDHCQFCRLAIRLAELEQERKIHRQLSQAHEWLFQWLETTFNALRQETCPTPSPPKPAKSPISLTDTAQISLTETAKFPKGHHYPPKARVTWLAPAARAVSSKDWMGQYESELQKIFPVSHVTVSMVLLADEPPQTEQIVLTVQVQRAEATHHHIVKLGTRPIVERDVEGWRNCGVDSEVKGSVLLNIRGKELPPDRFAAIYDDPLCLSRCGPENTATLESVTQQAIHSEAPLLDSVVEVVSQVFQEMRSCLYRKAREGSLERTLQIYSERLAYG
ncbi:MAG: hypothetical protein KDA84_02675, partial [Planctomycetaceae bacterium]|nr:hypothetical protein [Planctomycetaceae bacterium]